MDDDNDGFDDDMNNEEYYVDEENDLGGKIVSNGIEFLDESEIIKERENVIQEAIEKLFLDRDNAILAMIYLEWKLNKIESWYDDLNNNKVKAGIELSEETKEKYFLA